MEHEKKGNFRGEPVVFSRKVKAGKRRTYFFDVKSTRSNEYFLTITESKKRPDESYERFKVFVYKEDMNRFLDSLTETITHIRTQLMPDYDFDAFSRRELEYENQRNAAAAEFPPQTPKNESSETNTDETNTESSSSPATENQPENPPQNDEDLKW